MKKITTLILLIALSLSLSCKEKPVEKKAPIDPVKVLQEAMRPVLKPVEESSVAVKAYEEWLNKGGESREEWVDVGSLETQRRAFQIADPDLYLPDRYPLAGKLGKWKAPEKEVKCDSSPLIHTVELLTQFLPVLYRERPSAKDVAARKMLEEKVGRGRWESVRCSNNSHYIVALLDGRVIAQSLQLEDVVEPKKREEVSQDVGDPSSLEAIQVDAADVALEPTGDEDDELRQMNLEVEGVGEGKFKIAIDDLEYELPATLQGVELRKPLEIRMATPGFYPTRSSTVLLKSSPNPDAKMPNSAKIYLFPLKREEK